MTRQISEHAIPKTMATHPEVTGLLGEADIAVSPHARLRTKVLVFESNPHMRRFTRKVLGKPKAACARTLGLCQPLCIHTPTGWEVDPRYVSVVCLLRDHLTPEIIVHEAVHAGFAYAARQRCKQWVKGDAMDEEEIAYPVGRIADGINRFLHKHDYFTP